MIKLDEPAQACLEVSAKPATLWVWASASVPLSLAIETSLRKENRTSTGTDIMSLSAFIFIEQISLIHLFIYVFQTNIYPIPTLCQAVF